MGTIFSLLFLALNQNALSIETMYTFLLPVFCEIWPLWKASKKGLKSKIVTDLKQAKNIDMHIFFRQFKVAIFLLKNCGFSGLI